MKSPLTLCRGRRPWRPVQIISNSQTKRLRSFIWLPRKILRLLRPTRRLPAILERSEESWAQLPRGWGHKCHNVPHRAKKFKFSSVFVNLHQIFANKKSITRNYLCVIHAMRLTFRFQISDCYASLFLWTRVLAHAFHSRCIIAHFSGFVNYEYYQIFD